MMEKDILSVIIPVYNTSKYLERCLESVLHQTYQPLEIICVDDGSSDNSPEILKKYEASYPNVSAISHEKNKGLLEARRTGVENAHGEFIQFLDSDDTIDSELCDLAVTLIKKHNTDIVEFSVQQIDLENRDTRFINPMTDRLKGDEILVNYFITRKATNWLVNKIYRNELCKKAFEKIPRMNRYIGEDILTSFFIAYFASSYIGITTKPKYNYYLGLGVSTGKSMTIDKFKQYCGMNEIQKTVKNFLDKEDARPAAKLAYDYMTERLISDCYIYFTRISDENRDEAVRIFIDHWESNEHFLKAMLSVFSEQNKLIEDLYTSETYKLGNFLISLPHKIMNYRIP